MRKLPQLGSQQQVPQERLLSPCQLAPVPLPGSTLGTCALTHNVVAKTHCDAWVLLQLLQRAVEASLVSGLQHKVGHKVVNEEAQDLRTTAGSSHTQLSASMMEANFATEREDSWLHLLQAGAAEVAGHLHQWFVTAVCALL
jgi:hypothetical protein